MPGEWTASGSDLNALGERPSGGGLSGKMKPGVARHSLRPAMGGAA